MIHWPSSYLDVLFGKANSPLDKEAVQRLNSKHHERETVLSLHAEIVHNNIVFDDVICADVITDSITIY